VCSTACRGDGRTPGDSPSPAHRPCFMSRVTTHKSRFVGSQTALAFSSTLRTGASIAPTPVSTRTPGSSWKLSPMRRKSSISRGNPGLHSWWHEYRPSTSVCGRTPSQVLLLRHQVGNLIRLRQERTPTGIPIAIPASAFRVDGAQGGTVGIPTLDRCCSWGVASG